MRGLLSSFLVFSLLLLPSATPAPASATELHQEMMFNGHHIMLSDMMVRHTDKEIDDLFLDMLLELGVDSVSLYIPNSTYKVYTSRYDHIIDRIRSAGKKLVLLPYILPGKDEPLDEYFGKRLDVTLYHVKKYRPDIVIILNEPSIIGGVKMPPDLLQRYAENVSRKIKGLPDPPEVMVTIHSFELFLIPRFVKVKDIDIIAINLYSLKNFDNVEKAIEYIQSNGKKACIWETWWRTQKIGGGERLPFRIMLPRFRSYRNQNDACEWISFVYHLNLKHNLTILNPFFTEQFVYCNHLPYLPMFKQYFELLRAIRSERRTMCFHFYHDLIDSHHNHSVHVYITRPIKCLYINDVELCPISFAPLVIGKLTVHIEAMGAGKVEIYLDGSLISSGSAHHINCTLSALSTGRHTLKAVAASGNEIEEKELSFIVI